MKTLLITGASGFVGRNLVADLRSDGYEVLAPDEHALDLTRADAVADYLADHPVDVVVHSATTLRRETDYPDDVCERNLRLFFNLARAIRPGTRLINFGSGSEYARGHWQPNMAESYFGQHIPEDGHSYAKYVIARYIEDNPSLDAVTLRIFGIFGPHEDYRFKFISNAIAKNLCGLPIVINQNVVYDYLWVHDFSRVVRWFVENMPRHRAYNVTAGQPVDLLQIVAAVNAVAAAPSPVRVLNEGVGTTYTGDNRRLMGELGAFDFTPLDQSVAELTRHFTSGAVALDRESLQADRFLQYAQRLKTQYFKP